MAVKKNEKPSFEMLKNVADAQRTAREIETPEQNTNENASLPEDSPPPNTISEGPTFEFDESKLVEIRPNDDFDIDQLVEISHDESLSHDLEEIDKILINLKEINESDEHRIAHITKSDFLLNYPPEKMWHLFVDGAKQANGWKKFESNEPGYLLGMYGATLAEFENQNFNEPLSAETMLRIHDHATNGVQNTNYDTFGEHRDNFRDSESHVTFGCNLSGNMTKAGLEELRAFSAENPNSFGIIINEKHNDDGSIKIRYYAASCHSNDAKGDIENIIKNYHQELNSAKNDAEKIKAIIKMVSSAERIHPFEDANCRTFCMTLLTRELLKQNIMPPILDDPNQFDGLSQAELYEKVINGMSRMNEVIQKGELTTPFLVQIPIRGDQIPSANELTDQTKYDEMGIRFVDFPKKLSAEEKVNLQETEEVDALVHEMIYMEAMSKINPENLFNNSSDQQKFQAQFAQRQSNHQEKIDDLASRISLGGNIATNQLVEAVRFGCEKEVKNVLSKVDNISVPVLLSALNEAEKSKRNDLIEPLTQTTISQLVEKYNNNESDQVNAFLQAVYTANPDLATVLITKINTNFESKRTPAPPDLEFAAKVILAEKMTQKSLNEAERSAKSNWSPLSIFRSQSKSPDRSHITKMRDKVVTALLSGDHETLNTSMNTFEKNIQVAKQKGEGNKSTNFYSNLDKIFPAKARNAFANKENTAPKIDKPSK